MATAAVLTPGNADWKKAILESARLLGNYIQYNSRGIKFLQRAL